MMAAALLAVATLTGWTAAVGVRGAGLRDPLAVGVTGLALAAGALTQAMLWVAMALPGRLGPGTALVALLPLLALATCWRRARPQPGSQPPVETDGLPAGAVRVLAVAVVVGGAGVLLGAVLWPFGHGDALAVYGPLGRTLAETGALPAGEGLYEAYPLLLPMVYAAVEWLTGAPSPYLSRLAGALLAVGAAAGAGWLARELRSAAAGWLAAALLLTSPVYGRWAPSGYADLPAGFFLVVGAVFAWRWWRRRDPGSAVLGGLAFGLALWTKNSTLTVLVSAPLLAAAWWWTERRRPPGVAAAGPWRWSHWAAAAAAAGAVAGPFYLGNLVRFGVLVPVPGALWTDRARRDLAGLLEPLRPEAGFGVLGWVAAAVLALAAVRLVARRGAAPADALLVALVVPFVAAWWWWVSYDPRFLVTVLPVAAGFSGAALDRGIARLAGGRTGPARAAAVLVVAAALLGLPATLRRAVEHKRALLADPFPTGADRHRLQTGGLAEIARAVNRLPAGARVAGLPPEARYYLDLSRLPQVAWAGAGPEPCPEGYDAWVLAPDRPGEPGCPGHPVLHTGDGYRLVLAPGGGMEGGR